ncbi:hypothetical protein RI578_42005 (plasmid) [Streptomyces sp. BB1-1-1]|uniref:hypothetical protein n=1 Tax=Streptomyces sp. BB1-1-1 TaxID=3074430 RepID=UPI0028776A74|nr:hypothetical protein [Streptomyces sp. BB1-1-1]WND32900.1 hypothetical protein RI578_00625 [Streptomyces sp. BB1-1-1]WND40031.1 hypothetical protein RI578_39780 [Streptomyces sp. BB1-1-1]WND40865.1 hypothetical protein RI578_42005 [Streptomyces sp. BB1-1-1]
MLETSNTTEVASQYAVQVASDLERNAKEQERIGADIATLQEKLTALQQDHNVLVNIQQALAGTVPAPAAESTTVPSPRKKTAVEPTGSRRSQTARTTASRGRTAAKEPVAAKKARAAKAPAKAKAAKSDAPTLVELVRRHLAAQSEPRSAAEVSAGLNQAHPERAVQTTVVRNTLEGLVAKQRAQRTKQGSSVYYTATGGPEPVAGSEGAAQAEKIK